MIDPLSEVIALLRPRTVFSKVISGAGRWGVRYSDFGQPSFCTVLDGSCRLAVDGQDALTLEAGDFVLLPTTPGFTMSGFDPVTPTFIDPKAAPAPTDEVRHGTPDGDPDVRLLGGYFVFESPDAELLVSLLPALVHVRGAERLSTPRAARRRGNERAKVRSRPRAVAPCRCDAHRSVAVDARRGCACRASCADWAMRGSRWRCGRCTAIRRVPGPWTSSQRRRRCLARRSSIASRAPWAAADGIPSRLAHGHRKGSSAPPGHRHCRGRRTRRLWLGEHVQHRFSRHVGQPPSHYARERQSAGSRV